MTSSIETSLSPDINKMSLYTVIVGGPDNGTNKNAPPLYIQNKCNTRYIVHHTVTNYTENIIVIYTSMEYCIEIHRGYLL